MQGCIERPEDGGCVCVFFFGGGEVTHLTLTDLVGNKDLSAE